jgi:hypothetical protein
MLFNFNGERIMANKDNPIGGKPISSILSTPYNGRTNKYYIPASDGDDIWINDFVKLTNNSNEYGIPIVAKAAPGDKCVGIVTAIRDILYNQNFIYREANTERFIEVIDDPWVEIEIQVNGTITSTDVGKNADIEVADGNFSTGISRTQLDLSTLTTDSAQLKILGIIEREENVWGEYTHIRAIFAEHEFKDIPVYEENIWDRTGTKIEPKNAGDDLDMGSGDIAGGTLNITGKATIGGAIDPTMLLLDPQSSVPGTDNGTIYYNLSAHEFKFRENGIWKALSTEDLWNRLGTVLEPTNAGDDVDLNPGSLFALAGGFTAIASETVGLTPKATAPSPTNGIMYYDSTLNEFRFREAGIWRTLDTHTSPKRTASAGDYNPSALTDDYIIAMTDTSALRNVIISTEDVQSGSPTAPRIMIIKDEYGGAATYSIQVTLENGGTIDGQSDYYIEGSYNSISLYLDGTNGFLF